MNENWRVRRRHLPHVDVEGHPYFITACLQGCLSSIGLKAIGQRRLDLERQTPPAGCSPAAWERLKPKLLFAFIDQLLDHQSPVTHLADDRLAAEIEKAFLHFAGERYELLAYVVMPSHHHWLFMPKSRWVQTLPLDGKRTPREVISHSVQSFTANRCNRLRGGHGSFWQTETFDHFARNEAECFRIIHYIEQNPVAAGLVEVDHHYRWSSAHLRHRLNLPIGSPLHVG